MVGLGYNHDKFLEVLSHFMWEMVTYLEIDLAISHQFRIRIMIGMSKTNTG